MFAILRMPQFRVSSSDFQVNSVLTRNPKLGTRNSYFQMKTCKLEPKLRDEFVKIRAADAESPGGRDLVAGFSLERLNHQSLLQSHHRALESSFVAHVGTRQNFQHLFRQKFEPQRWLPIQ